MGRWYRVGAGTTSSGAPDRQSVNTTRAPVSLSFVDVLAGSFRVHTSLPRSTLNVLSTTSETQGTTGLGPAFKWNDMLAVLGMRIHVQWSQIFSLQH